MAQVQPNSQRTQRTTFDWRLALKMALFLAVGMAVLGITIDLTGTDQEGLAGDLGNGAVIGAVMGLAIPAAGRKARVLTFVGLMLGNAAAFVLTRLVMDLVF